MRVTYIKHGKIKIFILVLLLITVAILGIYSIGDSVVQSVSKESSVKLPIYCTDNDEREIALTINCAWGADDIYDILSVLDLYDVKATFFVLGTWAERYPNELSAIFAAGHEIGNHSYSHKLPSLSNKNQLEEEIDRCNAVVENIIGVRPSLYRAPSGDITQEVLDIAESKGMYNIKWSVDSIDWRADMTYDNILNRVLGRTQSGSILLFHNDTKHTAAVLPEIISSLINQDFKFVRVSELIYTNNYYIDHAGMQHGR